MARKTMDRRAFVGRSAAVAAAPTVGAAVGAPTLAQRAGSAKNLKVGWSTIYLTPS